jgi:hypothetical protein
MAGGTSMEDDSERLNRGASAHLLKPGRPCECAPSKSCVDAASLGPVQHNSLPVRRVRVFVHFILALLPRLPVRQPRLHLHSLAASAPNRLGPGPEIRRQYFPEADTLPIRRATKTDGKGEQRAILSLPARALYHHHSSLPAALARARNPSPHPHPHLPGTRHPRCSPSRRPLCSRSHV